MVAGRRGPQLELGGDRSAEYRRAQVERQLWFVIRALRAARVGDWAPTAHGRGAQWPKLPEWPAWRLSSGSAWAPSHVLARSRVLLARVESSWRRWLTIGFARFGATPRAEGIATCVECTCGDGTKLGNECVHMHPRRKHFQRQTRSNSQRSRVVEHARSVVRTASPPASLDTPGRFMYQSSYEDAEEDVATLVGEHRSAGGEYCFITGFAQVFTEYGTEDVRLAEMAQTPHLIGRGVRGTWICGARRTHECEQMRWPA